MARGDSFGGRLIHGTTHSRKRVIVPDQLATTPLIVLQASGASGPCLVLWKGVLYPLYEKGHEDVTETDSYYKHDKLGPWRLRLLLGLGSASLRVHAGIMSS